MLAGIFIVPNYTFFVELVLFLIVLGVIAKWILPPIQGALDERQRRVREDVRAVEDLQAQARSLAAERDEVLARAREEARSILDEAREAASRVREEARRRADDDRRRRVEAAVATLQAERPQVLGAAMEDLDRLVVAAAERVLGKQVDLERHRDVLAAARAAVERDAAASGAV